ncbi:hypothetical protein BU24DRAFT_351097 [Aaosphaeria arxii CBS 175.79]|uniref:C2H2-type domain-containing protein n=1 Tax=Aaosphaeria arxii CBS 175.79 TaxID=1450172 RepID=A0A6A5XKQ6_9PLEO|nr:uncharacterized protein BU24DRAFT_351097 [Aaosphaeria arxii CBS 175.79]KAF2013310.1 hypothetical protein BU24DRAFT_351097 [Aaosphaeria arxii CBS 175.79]
MAMAVDNRQNSHINAMGYDPLRYQQPHFTNPWVSATGATSQPQLYPTSIAPNTTAGLEAHPTSQPQQVQRPTSIALPYHGLAVTAPPLGTGIILPDGALATENLLDTSQDLLSRSYTSGYSTSAATNNTTYAPTSAPYSQMDYTTSTRSPYAYQQDSSRRSSHPSVPSTAFYESVDSQRQRQSSLVDFSRMGQQHPQRNSFSDALDASRGMVSLSQSDITPRNIYGNGSSRSSTDSYGFPSAHSAHSSISSASYNASNYYGGEGSVTDYSSASESVDLSNPRTLPRPNALMGANIPPAPQSMMGQFSSKVSSSSQKKHKCKICDKRFTRPSSLQTHMYSHTGEKPFACEEPGCGRHFSVVSNLRRHRKVHKGEGQDHPSPDDA